MAAKKSMLGLILSSYPYLRYAMVRYGTAFECSFNVPAFSDGLKWFERKTQHDKTYKSATTQSSEVEEDDEDEVKDTKNRRINFIIK